MISPELQKKIKLIEISTRRILDDVMTGNYRSHFKGQGMQFAEHRTYVPGDDVRHIDWKVSARTRDVLVKKFEEERELNVFLVVDLSASGNFGSNEKLKIEAVAEIASMLAHAAAHTGDKVGALLFAGEVEKIIPPKKGRAHVLRIVRDILSHQTKSSGTNLKNALETAMRVMKHKGIVFVISDFIASDYDSAIQRLGRKHDVVAVRVMDGKEFEIPPIGSVFLLNPETQEETTIDTRSYAFKKWIELEKKENEQRYQKTFLRSRIEELAVQSKEDYGEAVVRFFRARHQRRSR